jgi:hypothetical protein
VVVPSRILIGVGAWLLGAVAATCGSLLAVSQLGLGITSSTSQQLTASAVNSALASENREQPASTSARALHTRLKAHARRAAHSRQAAHAIHAEAGHSATAPAQPPATLLTSSGGSVLADCQAAGAYLLSWSPQQGFEAQNVARGPAAVASVRFGAQFSAVTVRVTCRAGIPTQTQSSWQGGGGDNGGGGGGDE